VTPSTASQGAALPATDHAGDFLKLIRETPLRLPDASKVDPLEATTVFAFHYKDGVVVAGDHRATAGNLIFSDRTDKILPLDHHSLMAIAGSPAVAFEMARTLQTAFEFYRRSQLQPLSLEGKVRALSRLLRDNLPATLQGIGAVAPIFTSLNADNKPVIYYYDPMGAHFEAVAFAGSGSGSANIKAILSYQDRWGSPPLGQTDRPTAIALANRVLMTAAEFDSATGGVHPDRGLFATIRLLTRDGVETVGIDEQQSAWENER
jgi:proteasome beta subunit